MKKDRNYYWNTLSKDVSVKIDGSEEDFSAFKDVLAEDGRKLFLQFFLVNTENGLTGSCIGSDNLLSFVSPEEAFAEFNKKH